MVSCQIVLLTGGAGFIGSHTARALRDAGHRVRLLDNLDPLVHGPADRFPESLGDGMECILGDVRDPRIVERALRDIDVVFHFAAATGVSHSMDEYRHYTDVNCMGTATLLEAVRRSSRVSRVILASSRAVYGEGAWTCASCGRFLAHHRPAGREVVCPQCGEAAEPAPTGEDGMARTASLYGLSKLYQERLMEFCAEATGISSISLRYFNVYGPGQSPRNPHSGILPHFLRLSAEGRPIPLFENGAPGRDFVNVRDVVRANLCALESTLTGAVAVNVGTGVLTRLKDLAELLGVPSEGVSHYRPGDIHICYADTRLAERLLGFRARVPLAEGLSPFRWQPAEGGASRDRSLAGRR